MARSLAYGLWARVFRLIPSVILAEPFECFWALYGLLAASSIVVRVSRHQASPMLAPLPRLGSGDAGVYAWGAILFVGSLLIGLGLSFAATRPLARAPRALESAGLLLFAFPIAQQLCLSIAHLHKAGPLFAYQLLSTLILATFVLAAAVRIVAISSPAGILAVSRISRIRLIRQELGAASKDARNERG